MANGTSCQQWRSGGDAGAHPEGCSSGASLRMVCRQRVRGSIAWPETPLSCRCLGAPTKDECAPELTW
eukprot:14270452-Alexandrium_andersonii.AAC.1